LNSSNLSAGTPKIPVLVIFAPTASGKTVLSFSLFGQNSPFFFKGKAEIVNADSMQVYRGMDIGTAKPDAELQHEIPHHLIDICNPDEQFSVSSFVRKADACCAEIWRRGKLPVVMGGAGFYIRCFLTGLPEAPQGEPIIRRQLEKRAALEDSRILYKELIQCDPVSAVHIHPNDAYRIVRALEVFHSTGRPLSSFPLSRELRKNYNFCILVLGRSRRDLYERIDKRTDAMFEQGLIEEYNRLIHDGYRASDPGMRAIGYREFADTFPSGVDSSCLHDAQLDGIREQIKQNSRRYAKKQYTAMSGIPEASFCPLPEGLDFSETVSGKITAFYSAVYLT
jgi:tRNA dimethylallyltransferase